VKFIVFVEGDTEHKALPDFMRRALSTKNPKQSIGVQTVKFEGWADMCKRVKAKANFYLDREMHTDVLGVLSLLDLYGPMYPANCKSVSDRKKHFKQQFEIAVGDDRFAHFSAVHEVEAWLLCQPEIFPQAVRAAVQKVQSPERVNFDSPPAVFLDRAYEKNLKQSYKKTVHGVNLFRELDPQVVESRCPAFKQLVDWAVARARSAGIID
jgi:hypothetical protein